MSADLVAYLLAREAEREAGEHRRWRVRGNARIDYTWRREMDREWVEVTEVVGYMATTPTCYETPRTLPQTFTREMTVEDFHAEFCEPDPDPWVLADIESKRRILEQVQHTLSHGFPAPQGMASEYALAMCVLDLMAQPYAGRDDFDPAWRLS